MSFTTQMPQGLTSGSNFPGNVPNSLRAKKLTAVLLWVALGLVGGMTILWEFVPLESARARLDAFPKSGVDFVSREVELSEAEKSVFGKADILKRVYQVGGQRVVTQIVDGTRDRHAVHDPKHCFRGAGWNADRGIDLPLGGGLARQLTLKRNQDEVAEVVYWFTDGKTRHATPLRCWWQTSLRRMTFGRSGGEPLLVILQPLSGETIDWPKLISDFTALSEL